MPSYALNQHRRRILLFLLPLFLAAPGVRAQPDFQKELQRQFILVKDGGTILIPEGTYELDVTLSLDNKKRVTLLGMGMDKTILRFSRQVSGGEGIRITNSRDITIRDLTVRDSKGDAIKAQQVDGISFIRCRTDWSRGSHKDNGAYGLYPVQCSQVLIDSCEARAASDAGIYVGQSDHIIVRNSRAYENVAGIEIENSTHADVHDNECFNNTGGILVFDLPDLPKKNGRMVRVFNNTIRENNHKNFAPKGNIVAKVPQGTGVMILGTRQVEVFNNRILNHRTVGTAIVSYYMTEIPIKDSLYDPFPNQVYIHDNIYERKAGRVPMAGRIGKMYRFKLRFGKYPPHILYDGILRDEWKQAGNKDRQICIRQNQENGFADIDAANGFRKISRDLSPFACELTALPAAQVRAGY